jgi:hypothetical protein
MFNIGGMLATDFYLQNYYYKPNKLLLLVVIKRELLNLNVFMIYSARWGKACDDFFKKY